MSDAEVQDFFRQVGSHYRGVLLSRQKFGGKGWRALQARLEKGAQPSGFSHFRIATSFYPGTSRLEELAKVRGDRFEYPTLIRRYTAIKQDWLLLASPEIRLLDEAIKKFTEGRDGDVSYLRCELKVLCDHQYESNGDGSIIGVPILSRLHGRVMDEESTVRSIALYGSDVLKSKILRRVIESRGAKEISRRAFSKEGRVIEPKSCRLTLDNGAIRSALNLDGSGNLGFYVRSDNEALSLVRILDYMRDLGALADTTLYPLPRSSAQAGLDDGA